MFLIRDIMYCKPGQVRAMTQKFLALSKLTQQMGMGQMRVMTDVSAERYWTVVSEMEVESIEKFKMASNNADLPPPFGPINTVIGESLSATVKTDLTDKNNLRAVISATAALLKADVSATRKPGALSVNAR